VSNVLSQEKQKQVVALGQLGWSARRIEQETGVRRETVARYLREAGVAMREPRRRRLPEPRLEGQREERAKADSGVTTDSQSVPDPKQTPSQSLSAVHRETIEEALGRGRNAKGIWQDLVDRHGFAGSYESVKRYVRDLRGASSPVARAVIETAPGEDYGECRVMVRRD
jgi:transposase